MKFTLAKNWRAEENMLEQEVQARFISFVTGTEEILQPESHPLSIYRDLVFYRFYEVLRSGFPLFREKISDQAFQAIVKEYIKCNPKQQIIWKMPLDFLDFCLQKEDLCERYAWLPDLLWYEWTETELLMSNYDFAPVEDFCWDKTWKFSPSTRTKMLKYPVYLPAFFGPEQSQTGEFWLLMYYNFDEHAIHFQEITFFMFELINLMNNMPANVALSEIAARKNLDSADLKDILSQTLAGYCHKKILVRV